MAINLQPYKLSMNKKNNIECFERLGPSECTNCVNGYGKKQSLGTAFTMSTIHRKRTYRSNTNYL